MKDKELNQLKKVIGSEKTYLKDGYYRIRENDFEQYELAYLKPDGCGTTTIHPQITISKIGEEWIAIKLLDMGVSPTKALIREEENKLAIDYELQLLVEKMTKAIS